MAVSGNEEVAHLGRAEVVPVVPNPMPWGNLLVQSLPRVESVGGGGGACGR